MVTSNDCKHLYVTMKLLNTLYRLDINPTQGGTMVRFDMKDNQYKDWYSRCVLGEQDDV